MRKQKIKNAVLILVLLSFNQILLGQNSIKSSVITKGGEALSGASVVLLNPLDSVVTKGSITNEKGEFAFDDVPKDFLLHVSFVGYQAKMIHSKYWLKEQSPIVLDKSENQLAEVQVIKARNRIQIEENKIVFNAQGMDETRAASTAFALLDYVPGLLVQNDQVSVLGSPSVTIIIDNKITNMSMDQVVTFLKATPSADVKNIEYYFVAPKRFNVHGALINIELKRGIEKGKFSGTISGEYLRGRKNSYDGNLNLSLNQKKFELQALVNQSAKKSNDKQIISTYFESDEGGELNQFISTNSDKNQQMYSLNPRFNFTDSSYVDLLYSFIPESNKGKINSLVNLDLSSSSEDYTSTNDTKGEPAYHNLAMTYCLKNSNFGFGYSNYKDPTNQDVLTINTTSLAESIYTSDSEQEIQEWSGYLNNTSSIKNGKLSLEYGLSYKYINNNSSINEYEDSILTKSKYNLEENRGNGYVTLNCQLLPKLSSMFALELEYDKLQFQDKIEQSEYMVVDDYFIFPTLDLTYVASNNHIFKANFTSFSEYPSFWDLTPYEWTLTPYASVQGNPSLTVQRNYNSQFVSIFKGKYIFVLSTEMYRDWITQVPFTGDDGYSIIYKTINIDKNDTQSMALVIPFSPFKKLSSKFTASLSRNIQKDSSHDDYSIDKKNVNYYFALNNSLTVNAEREIFFDLNGYYASGRPQGFYDLKASFCIDASFRMKIAKSASFVLACKDIFNSKTPNAITEFDQQYTHFNFDFDTREFKIGFVYHFGEKVKMRKSNSDLKPSDRFKRN
jgi:hypothetical protein